MGNRSHPPGAAIIIILTIMYACAGCVPGDHPLAPAGALSDATLVGDPEGCIGAIRGCYEDFEDLGAI